MSEHILKPLNCINDANGNTFRPFELDGEVVYHYPLSYTMTDEDIAKKEMMKLCLVIRNKTGIELIPEDIPKILRNGGKILS